MAENTFVCIYKVLMPRVLLCNELCCSEGNFGRQSREITVNEEHVTKTKPLQDFLDERLIFDQINHTANHFIPHCG